MTIQEKCKALGCPNYIEWSYYGQGLVSCKLQGESEIIEAIADDCPNREKFKEEGI